METIQDNLNSSGKENMPSEVDFDEEVNIARKVLKKFTSSSTASLPSLSDDTALSQSDEETDTDERVKMSSELAYASAEVADVPEPENAVKSKTKSRQHTEGEEDLHRTVFISNLPFDIENEEVKQRFSGFGEVQSFVPVLHPVTKYGLVLLELLLFFLLS